MHVFSDLEVVIQSRGGRNAMSVLFLISLLAVVDMLLMPILIRSGAIRPLAMDPRIHLLLSAFEIGLLVGSCIFWLAMLCMAVSEKRHRLAVWLIWMGILTCTGWYGALIYYLFVFRRLGRSGAEQPT
jgi:hypothetical protein